MIRNFIWLLLITGTFSMFSSCGKCRTKDKGEYYFSSADLAIVPYNGNEILVFKNQSGDSICLTGENRSSKMEHGYSYAEGETECPETIWEYQTNTTNFNNSDNSSDSSYMWIKLYKNISTTNDFIMYFIIKSPISFEIGVSIHFETNNLYDYNNNLMTPSDSLSINNEMYFSVYTLSKNDLLIYYTLNNGVVGFKTSDNVEWNLK